MTIKIKGSAELLNRNIANKLTLADTNDNPYEDNAFGSLVTKPKLKKIKLKKTKSISFDHSNSDSGIIVNGCEERTTHLRNQSFDHYEID